MPKTFSNVKTNIDDGVRWEDELPFEVVDIRKIAKGDYKAIRLVGYVEPFMRFWVPTEASKANDPYSQNAKQYPTVCVDFDPDTEDFVRNDCVYRKAHYKYTETSDSGEVKSHWGTLKPSKNYLIFFIDRERQEDRDGVSLKRKCTQPKKASDIQCATVPTAFAREVQGVIEMYAKKNGGRSVDPTDPKKGYDLFFKYDPDANSEAKYKMQLGDDAPLTEDELKQTKIIPETVNIFPKDSPEKATASLLRSGYVICENGEDPEEALLSKKEAPASRGTMKAGANFCDDDDDDDEQPSRKPRKQRVAEEFDDEEDDLGLGDEPSEEEEETPKKAKKKKASKKAPVEEPEDQDEPDEPDDPDDDFDFDDDDL